VVTAISREILRDVIRITVEMDREAIFHENRLEKPPRMYVDLPNTTTLATLRNHSMVFAGELIQRVRLGSPKPRTTRVVLDLDSTARYSVYPLYGPFRLIIDVERAQDPIAVAAQTQEPAVHATTQPATSRRAAGSSPSTPTPGASWTLDPLPARTIEAAVTNSIRTSRATVPVPVPEPPPLPQAGANTVEGYSLSRQLGLGVSRVVIDPGHGGRDPGARVKGLNEADLVLDIALRLEKLLKKQRGVEVVLTRRANVYVPLERRTALANKENADLFLSIHVNASKNPTARGLETYYLNFAPNPDAARMAARENVGSARTMHALPDIVKAIALNNKIDESREFATLIQSSLVDRLRLTNHQTRDLGVKQAPFMVLIGATMPSVLTEVSFITNRDEGRLLRTAKYRQHIADALFQGIRRYQGGLKSELQLASQ
jgi:N-acetylmuramoyl-L-alanine amidase